MVNKRCSVTFSSDGHNSIPGTLPSMEGTPVPVPHLTPRDLRLYPNSILLATPLLLQ